MILKSVEYLPYKTQVANNQKLGEIFEKFMKMNVKYAQVLFKEFEYATEMSCRGSLHSYIHRNPNLPVSVTIINGEIYLIRTDKED